MGKLRNSAGKTIAAFILFNHFREKKDKIIKTIERK
jgi:hypothetical protein